MKQYIVKKKDKVKVAVLDYEPEKGKYYYGHEIKNDKKEAKLLQGYAKSTHCIEK